ncbi:uncharacterized protein LOC142167239 [Nicotiana tabacum]|uniref:Uncharacterized protein LOC142167239 n=1 Tax=Nicotiana tabacum TaxID=4097 RepID=A0AC58SEV4_TOBAC
MALLKACKAFGVHATGFESDIMGLIFRMEEKRNIKLQQLANTEVESNKRKSKGGSELKKLSWGLQEGSSSGKKERVKYSVLVNRSPVGFFSPQKGLGQGDHLSPFLFLLAMEGLTKMLVKAKEMNWIHGFQVGRNPANSVIVSHLLYADDTLIFCGAERLQVSHLNLTLLIFESISGLHINMLKSTIYPVNEYLSMDGRLTLISSVLDSTPTYCMSLYPMPSSVLKQLDRLRRRFLWEGNNTTHKFPLVKWAKVIQPKSNWGMGLMNLKLHNKSMLIKWLWRYGQPEPVYWKEVITAKHGAQNQWCTKENNAPYEVELWKHIRSLQTDFLQEITYRVGNGSHVKFWEDRWIGNTTLRELYPGLYQIASRQNSMVAHNREGNTWNPLFRRNLQDWKINDLLLLLSTLEECKIE